MTLVCAGSAFAQSEWTTVDDVLNGNENDVQTDTAGNVYVAGSVGIAQPDGTTRLHAVVTKSSDYGETWSQAYFAPEAIRVDAIATAAIATPQEGSSAPLVNVNHLVLAEKLGSDIIVRRSLDSGVSWSRVGDSIPLPNGFYNHYAAGAALDSAGNIYLACNSEVRTTTTVKRQTTTTSVFHLLVRKWSADNTGQWSWRIVGDFTSPTSAACRITCVGGNVFALGVKDNFWNVFKSSDGGTTWSSVDRFQFSTGYASEARGITADHSGNIIVCGYGFRPVNKTTTQRIWIVRKGTGIGSNSFRTIDDKIGGANAEELTVDPQGNIHVVGSATDSLIRWCVRKGTPSVNSTTGAETWIWVTTDMYSQTSNRYGQGWHIAAAPSGILFATGWSPDSSGKDHYWLVRRNPAKLPLAFP